MTMLLLILLLLLMMMIVDDLVRGVAETARQHAVQSEDVDRQ